MATTKKVHKPMPTDFMKVCKDYLVEGGEIDFTNLGVKDRMEAIKLLQGPGFGSVIKVREYLGTHQTKPESAPVVLTAQIEATDPDEEFCNISLTWVEDGSLKTILRKVSNRQPAFKSFAELPASVFPYALRNSCMYWQSRYMDRFRNILNFWDDHNDPQYISKYGGNLGPDPNAKLIFPIFCECGRPMVQVPTDDPKHPRYYCEDCNVYQDFYGSFGDDGDEDTDNTDDEVDK